MSDPTVLILCLIALITLMCQWVAWWIRIPSILFLLIAGIIIGPTLGWLNPTKTFADLLKPIVALSVAVILFEGSLTLKKREFSDVRHVVRNLISYGMLITIVLTACFTHWLFGLSWQLCVLLGAMTAVTGPTVIVPMLHSVRPSAQIANILRWEGIAIDPIGAIIAVLVYEFIVTINEAAPILHLTAEFCLVIFVGAIIGIVAGYSFGQVLKRYWLPEFLHNISTLSLVLVVYAIADFINSGAGLLAVTLMGITLTNMKDVPVEDILGFKESLSILLISGLFIIIAAQMQFPQLNQVIRSGIILCIILQFIVRPVNILFSTIRSGLNWREKALLAWVSPRGIVAAAVAAIFSLRLVDRQVANAELLFPLTFLIILFTVIFQSLTAKYLARWLQVAEPDDNGFLIVGANPLAREIGEALQAQGFRIHLTSRSWTHARQARMKNIPVYFGNPISDHADRHLDLIGIDNLLSITPPAEN